MTEDEDFTYEEATAEELMAYLEMVCSLGTDRTCYLTTQSGVVLEVKMLYNAGPELTSTDPIEIH